MIGEIENGNYNRKIICSDWRYGGSIIGLRLYFDFHQLEYEVNEDYMLYKYEDIEKDKYLLFAEHYFAEFMHHKKIESLLLKDELDDKEIKDLNDLSKKNTILKNLFKEVSYPNSKENEIKEIIDNNRLEIIEKTFSNGKNLYSKFSNSNCFFKEQQGCCRLLGYTFDTGRKSKAYAYMFDDKTFVYEDCLEFDFIPFAFTRTTESIFINNNTSVENLWQTHNRLNNEMEENPRNAVFNAVNKTSTFIDYDVEAIIMNTGDNSVYETLFIRKCASQIFQKINYYEHFKGKFIKITDKDYLNLEKEITNRILNLTKFDDLIIYLIKLDKNRSHINTLIKTNIKVYEGDEKMERESLIAKKKAEEITRKIGGNKVNSFKNKLLSALAINDYNNFNVILLKLSSYSAVDMPFAYDLFDDFEKNKNVAFSFINALGSNGKNETDENKNKEEKGE